ncbi:SDR family NAD(P)-dependent oxidoreductase [Starkeya sp. ORNL1]|uniref:SDR family NAD(P)-dependent oxidoreductase n=1 Tax=Starkeya sp. ORNL1 TaxID=2709380 RepID=UPI001462EC5A|nr:SDR family NAD(P)-dependent oxidoreductase [Starkeya sp. ORNL1]QJP14535.1 SDR family NAD(P)-dependent oxidoreductase [Starkeya sp. ORNL1]
MSRIWFVTGAARGIGAEIVKAALANGDKVVATGRRIEALEAAFGSSPDVLPLALDVADEAAAQRAVEAALARFGRIDVLVNNAGYGQLGLFEEIEPADIERQFATNVFGLFHVTRAALPAMRRQRSGHIVNLSSMAGVVGFTGAAVYCATKFAVEGFSDSLATEVADFGIGVTLVEPGFTRTDFLEASSVAYGTRHVADYDDTSARAHADFHQYNGQQAGDPVRLAAALVTIAGTAKPPLRLATGSDAVVGIGAKLERMRDELGLWRDLSVSVDRAA